MKTASYIAGFIVDVLMFWAFGNFAIHLFKIDFIWTIWHGLFVEFGYNMLKQLFRK